MCLRVFAPRLVLAKNLSGTYSAFPNDHVHAFLNHALNFRNFYISVTLHK